MSPQLLEVALNRSRTPLNRALADNTQRPAPSAPLASAATAAHGHADEKAAAGFRSPPSIRRVRGASLALLQSPDSELSVVTADASPAVFLTPRSEKKRSQLAAQSQQNNEPSTPKFARDIAADAKTQTPLRANDDHAASLLTLSGRKPPIPPKPQRNTQSSQTGQTQRWRSNSFSSPAKPERTADAGLFIVCQANFLRSYFCSAVCAFASSGAVDAAFSDGATSGAERPAALAATS